MEPASGEQLALAGTSWSVTHHYSAEYNGATNVWPDSGLTMEFASDGTLSGYTGCNTYSGEYELIGPNITEPGLGAVRGQQISITGLEWTEAGCPNEDLTLQEQEFLEAVPQAEYAIIGEGFGGDNDLLLRSDDKGLLVEGAPLS